LPGKFLAKQKYWQQAEESKQSLIALLDGFSSGLAKDNDFNRILASNGLVQKF